MHKFRELLEASSNAIVGSTSLEHRKLRADALGAVTRGLEVVELALTGEHRQEALQSFRHGLYRHRSQQQPEQSGRDVER